LQQKQRVDRIYITLLTMISVTSREIVKVTDFLRGTRFFARWKGLCVVPRETGASSVRQLPGGFHPKPPLRLQFGMLPESMSFILRGKLDCTTSIR